jgi:O-antigen ligase
LPKPSHRKTAALAVIFILLLWMLLQLAPLPPAIVAWLSPERASDASLARAAASGNPHTWLALSVAPAASIERLLAVVPAMVAFFVARELCRVWRAWTVVVPVIVIAALESALGLLQFYAMRMNNDPALSVTGTYVNRNHFAGLLEMAFPLAAVAAIAVWRRRHDRGSNSIKAALATTALVCVAACLLSGVVVSLSRMGFVSVLAAALLTVAILLAAETRRSGERHVYRWAVPAVLIPLVLLALPPRELLDRFAAVGSSDVVTNEIRLAIWHDTLQEIRAYKWTGAGLGAYERGMYKFKTVAPLNTVDFAHNDYLQIVAELGFLGAALVAALIALVLWPLLRVIWTGYDTNWELAVGVLAAMLAIGFHSLADFNLYIPANALVLAWLFGVADYLGARGQDPPFTAVSA